MTTSSAWIGVDICKKYLDVAATIGTPVRIANDADGRTALARRLKCENVRGVIVEATGGRDEVPQGSSTARVSLSPQSCCQALL